MKKVLQYLGSNLGSVILMVLVPPIMAVGGVALSAVVLTRTLRGRGLNESMRKKIRIGGWEV